MRWKNLGFKGGTAVVLMVALMGCMPIQPVTPSATDATPESTTEATTEATGGTTAEATSELTPEPVEETTTPESATYDDPFAYCAAVGTVDEPDER